MLALGPVSSWIPEDDLLLKNAVEAGASLEALAKGAVRFSRRFTIQELQNRWHALLYDPDTSGPASAHMVELEFSSASISSESNKMGDFKVNGFPEKRKGESVRSQYYAMRKRIRNEPFSNVDLSFLAASTPHHCEEQFMNHDGQPVQNCMIGNPHEDDFGLHDANFDMSSHGFPQITRVDGAVGSDEAIAHTYLSKHQDSLEGGIPDGIVGGNCLYGFEENIPTSVNEVIGSKVPHSFEHGDLHSDIDTLEEKFSAFETTVGVQDMRTPGELPGENLFGSSNPATKSFCEFDIVNNNPVSICSGFGQSQDFNSPVSDCGVKFHQLEYSSPLPTVPIWRTMEDMSAPSILNNENLDDKDRAARDTATCHVTDTKQVCSSDYNVVHPNPQLQDRMPGDGLNSSTTISDEFFSITHSLMEFTNEEVLLLMDVDGKDMIDRACLDGLSSIFNSPNEVQPNDITSFTEPKVSVSMDACMMNPNICSGDYGLIDDKLQYGYRTSDSNTDVPSSTLVPNPYSPERQNGVICCVLNTEDPDIPSNNDVCLPNEVGPSFTSSGPQHSSEEDGNLFPLSTTDISHTQMSSERGSNHAKEEIFPTSQVIDAQYLPEISSGNPVSCGVTSELPENVILDMTSRHLGIVEVDPSQCASSHLIPYSISASEMTDDNAKVEPGKHCNFDGSVNFLIENSANCSDDDENHQYNTINDYKQELDTPGAIQVDASAEHGSFEFPISEPGLNPSIPAQEVPSSEDEYDVPHFSDIEALILDMDLDPCDQDYLSKEVSRYQHEEAQRAILRLEQSAHSYMQRAITSHRAFAILYGRRMKHYIRKPEVSLGRATDGTTVDVDLAKEGRANKISRHQATIKMEEDGSFSLKNLGKGSVVVNGKEVATGHCVNLYSGCLIEIRCLSFIFETNEKAVKHFLNNTAKSLDNGSKFEWSHEEVS